ncbi:MULTISPECIES: LysR substrate-binding domain-containing protein [Nocardioides]|uniref:LysR substrate-binding domain-containing protein n=1 Tax=Nocardioides vastitatis TaxID=2568655 RepID=A0ABW0ZJY0_9ACTN|nr:LysR substrate-binding domain-containing protein [Nocardioides sp.]THJ04332.1 LysR family transcriptional regulator [Nocardioides sp.]
MELRHLRYFVAVAEELHFGRAATRLHIAQPPLSQQIRTLEAELGVELLHRTTRKVELTSAGTAYLERARAVLAAVDDAGHEARQVAAGVVGRLVVSCVGSATYSLLPQLARGLTGALPGIEFSFRGEMLVPDQIQALRADEVDVALLRPPVHDATIRTVVLRHDRLLVALPADHPLATRRRVRVGDLSAMDLVVHTGRQDSVMHAMVVRMCRGAGFEPRFRAEVGETSTLITLVAGGLGAAVVPEPVTALGLSGVVYLPLVDGPSVDLAVSYRQTRDEPHLLRAVEEIRRLVVDG